MYYRVRINILLLRASDYPKEEEEHDEPYALLFTAALLERKLNGGVPDTQYEFDAMHGALTYLYRSGSPCVALMASMLRLYSNIQSTEIAHIQDTVQKLTKLYQQEQREEHPDDRTLESMHDFMLWCASSEKVKTMKSD
jgi:ABC-type transporter Mla MlaB component